ncbi:histidine triad nucleotide-binding protein [Patescibacteria group bacterium]|nr:histidine triad nucleotide-binding protein [Patescibacteria group bacterium]MBU1075263.1 histidine triad nucleotide-binding protein [Patescibacteria group bacterium]MBU1951493.1 histidine triad nucleotide-binding protein [Patescibacteria group bacterium]MBU2228892.1 histidine triad nucleotide-binding protein [Patescibacteria group bacterium]MBU2236069.1 histidine triad nucleotide-binding protein [Patescibacteria group bacterium]
MDCIFCSISKKEVSADVVFENDEIIAFKDIAPQAPVHILVLPKKHIAKISDLSDDDAMLIGNIVNRARILAKKQGISDSGFRLVFNCGDEGGQVVDHIHLHLIGGKKLGEIG